MAVIIENMELPCSCSECNLCSNIGLDKFYCDVTTSYVDIESEKRASDCPLKEVPTGKWICESKGRNYADYHCSVCGQKLSLCGQDIHERMAGGYSLYCDRCGARMVEPQESEDKE